ncbi:MAG: c-type cytochrome [Deltaproteobacteria bacterium]|nr:c-type cytochrome [Deltaproteobacteria bacterium]
MKRNALHSLLLASSAALSMFAAACGSGTEGKPWAMRPITRDYTFPIRCGADSPVQCDEGVADGAVVPEGMTVSAADLNKGRHLYINYCYACHGMNGDGNGPASHGLRPAPRDLRMGKYKFDTVASGLPNDIDFSRIIKGGLHGTAMLKWDIKNDELYYLIQFIKTFPKPPCNQYGEVTAECREQLAGYPDSSLEAELGSAWEEVSASGKNKGKLKPTGEPVVPQHYDEAGTVVVDAPANPWVGKEADAIKKGEELYHFKFECTTCHAHYLSRKQIYDYKFAVSPEAPVTYRDAMFYAVPQQNAVQDFGVATMPPDFTMNPLRSIRQGTELPDLYRLIAAGVGVMPSWAQSAQPEELWALVHYVKSLKDLQLPANAARRDELKARLHADKFMPPPPPKKEETAPAEEGAGGGDAAAKDGEKPVVGEKADAAVTPDDKKADDKKADEKKSEKKADKKKAK